MVARSKEHKSIQSLFSRAQVPFPKPQGSVPARPATPLEYSAIKLVRFSYFDRS